MKYFDILLGRYLGGCGKSSSESCDYTTVKATITNNSSDTLEILLPVLAPLPGGETGLFPGALLGHGSLVFDAVVYKGTGIGRIDTNHYSGTVTVSGDAEYDGGYIDFTGDFSLTYTSGIDAS